MKTPFDKPTQNDPIINGEWGSPAPYKVNRWVKKDSTQNDHETHTACIERIRKEGASSTCCYCDPHEGCTLGMKPTQNDWEKKVSEWFSSAVDFSGNEYGYQSRHDGLIELVAEIRADARKEVIKRIEAMPDKDVRPEITVWLESKEYCLGYNKALSNVLATLKEEGV